MKAHNIIIGGIEVSYDASTALDQTYETIGGFATLRTLNGTAIKQTNWTKLRTRISGSGNMPAGLDALDYSASLTIQCAAPRTVGSISNVITLPAARRTDHPPHGYAIVNGRQVRTAVSIATNTATLTTVAGATTYVCAYYPTLTVFANPPQLSFDARGVVAGWTIEAEEV